MSARFEIRFDPYARRALDKIDKTTRRRILVRIAALADEPRPPGAVMLTGRRGDWRIRIGDYRVIYTEHDEVLIVLVIEVGHRRSVYSRANIGTGSAWASGVLLLARESTMARLRSR